MSQNDEQTSHESPIAVALRRLNKSSGIYQANLRDVIGSELCRLWHIDEDDDELLVRVKVIWQLDRLISGIEANRPENTKQVRNTARVRFNLLDIPGFRETDLVTRVRRFQREHDGPSEATSIRQMRGTIIPSFEEQLRLDARPAPSALLVVVREAQSGGPILEPDTAEPGRPAATSNAAKDSARRLLRKRPLALTGAVLAVLILGSLGWWSVRTVISASTNKPDVRGGVVITVQNKVARGSNRLIEGSTPAYLSTKPEPSCAEQQRHCEVPNTKMHSGAKVIAFCYKYGSEMRNYDVGEPGTNKNPYRADSRLWYEATKPNGGRFGYISEVYTAATNRRGMGLPKCKS